MVIIIAYKEMITHIEFLFSIIFVLKGFCIKDRSFASQAIKINTETQKSTIKYLNNQQLITKPNSSIFKELF